ncbi:MAG: hypothetical protein V1799_04320 [bacterium]
MTVRDKIFSLDEIELSRYEGIDLDRLVIYAVTKLDEIDAELSLENIIIASFKLFPKKFSLIGYPEFPDATRVEKCLWRCKGKRRCWIGGKTPHGYSLTGKGNLIYTQVEKLLLSETKHNKKVISQTRRKELIIVEVISSRAYQKFVQNRGENITDAEFCSVLQGTLDSLKENLKENLYSMKNIANELDRNDVAKFLDFLESRFSKLLLTR